MKMNRFTFLGMILIFEILSMIQATKTEHSDKMKPAVDQSLYPEDAKGVVRIPVFVTFSIMRGETVGRIAGGFSKFFFNSKIVNWFPYQYTHALCDKHHLCRISAATCFDTEVPSSGWHYKKANW
jgi:hypothetical protein